MRCSGATYSLYIELGVINEPKAWSGEFQIWFCRVPGSGVGRNGLSGEGSGEIVLKGQEGMFMASRLWEFVSYSASKKSKFVWHWT